MVFNGEVRSLFPHTDAFFFPIKLEFIGHSRRNCSYLGFSALQNTCLSFVTNDHNNTLNILTWSEDWLGHFALLTSWQANLKLQKAFFLSALITNVVPIFSYQPQHTNVCFWYLPPSLRGLPDGEERRERLHKVLTHQSASYAAFSASPALLIDPYSVILELRKGVLTLTTLYVLCNRWPQRSRRWWWSLGLRWWATSRKERRSTFSAWSSPTPPPPGQTSTSWLTRSSDLGMTCKSHG